MHIYVSSHPQLPDMSSIVGDLKYPSSLHTAHISHDASTKRRNRSHIHFSYKRGGLYKFQNALHCCLDVKHSHYLRRGDSSYIFNRAWRRSERAFQRESSASPPRTRCDTISQPSPMSIKLSMQPPNNPQRSTEKAFNGLACLLG